jgi:hypothetical protein
VFAGSLTARVEWTEGAREEFHCRVLRTVSHAPFKGFNRAQAAVIEAAILVSRLRLLPREKIEREMHYLEIAIGKTASADELEAWNWLVDAVTRFYAGGDTQIPRTARRTVRRGSSFRVLQTCAKLLAPNSEFGRQVAVDLITSADFNENGRCPSHDISPSCGILL